MNPKNNNRVSISEFLTYIECLDKYTKKFIQLDNNDYAIYYIVDDVIRAIHYVSYKDGEHSYYINY